MGEVVVVEAELTRGHSYHHSFSIRSSSESAQVIPITTSPPCEGEEDGTNWRSPGGGGGELNPLDAWLPITESRNGNTFSVTFHLLCSGFGFQALLLPVAFATLGWAWGIICLSLAYTWQLYTIWLLVQLHESESGIRYSRYIHLAVTAYGPKLGKLLCLFPVMYLSGGTCVQLIIVGGSILKLFFNNVCDAKTVTTPECYLLFTCLAIVGAHLPNLNSIAKVSFIGTITAIVYCTLIWSLSIAKGRLSDLPTDPPLPESNMDRFGGIMNAVGIISLAFRGHNLILEIQGTLPSSPKHPTHKPMWGGVTISYAVIATCLLPLAVCGFWAYGNKVPSSIEEILTAAAQFHGHKTSKCVLGIICILVLINCSSAFPIYGMVVFDNLEMRYSIKKKKPCARWLRVAFRILFGGFVFFIAMAFPFLISLAVLIGGLAFPLTYVHPCLMWIAIKKPKPKGVVWCINMGLGCLGLCLSIVLVVAASWNIAQKALAWGGVGAELNPQDAWLPLTESRKGNAFSASFHLLCSGIGVQALLLPVAFATLGWLWGIVCLSVAFSWQLYTIWLLVHLHESDSGTRYSRYLDLAITVFGQKLGKVLALVPVMYLSAGTCVQLIIIGGGTIRLFIRTLCRDGSTCDPKSLTGAECFLVFMCMAVVVAQFPNLNSLAWVSFIGTTTAVVYCTLIWGLSIGKGRINNVSYDPPAMESNMERFGGIMNAIGIICLAFRGHNVILEIQGTLPTNPEFPTCKTMRGVTASYLLIAICLLPLGIAGFWTYGNKVPSSNGGLLIAILQYHADDASIAVLGLICILVIVHCLSTFQIYGMVIFDKLEANYTSRQNKPCARWLRTALRVFFGGVTFFAAVTFPFLGSLAPLIGGATLPLTYAYPCWMWIAIKKPQPKGAMWCVNMGLGFFGLVLSLLLVVAAAWNLGNKGLHANFFKP